MADYKIKLNSPNIKDYTEALEIAMVTVKGYQKIMVEHGKSTAVNMGISLRRLNELKQALTKD